MHFGHEVDPDLGKQPIVRNSIVLNAAFHSQLYCPEATWGGLIHEMLHAYLGIMTSSYADDDRAPGDHDDRHEKHGPLFRRGCNILAWRLNFTELTSGDVRQYADGQLGFIVPVEYEKEFDQVSYPVIPKKWRKIRARQREERSDGRREESRRHSF